MLIKGNLRKQWEVLGCLCWDPQTLVMDAGQSQIHRNTIEGQCWDPQNSSQECRVVADLWETREGLHCLTQRVFLLFSVVLSTWQLIIVKGVDQ